MARVKSCRKCGRRAMVGHDLCAPHYVEEQKKLYPPPPKHVEIPVRPWDEGPKRERKQ
jgi:hypothetical protein